MDCFDHCDDILDRRLGQNPVAQVEYMAWPAAARVRISETRRRISFGEAKSAAGSRFP